jgi:AcrR family transcriptional regulator
VAGRKRAAKKKGRGEASPANVRVRYHHGDLRRALLDAALALVNEGGPKAMTLREAARRVKVSEAAPYRHFASREALLAAVAEEGFREFGASQRAAWELHPGDPFDRLEALGLAYVDYAVRAPAHFRVMFGAEFADAAAYPETAAVASASREPVEETVQECLRALGRDATLPPVPAAHSTPPSPRPPPGEVPDAVATLVMVWSVVHGVSLLLVDRRLYVEPTPEAARTVALAVLRSMIRGLRP